MNRLLKSRPYYRFVFIMVFFVLLVQYSCNKNRADEALIRENERLKQKLNEQAEPVIQTKYVWSIIYFKSGSFTWGSADPKGHFRAGTIEENVFWSDIKEVYNFNEDKEYKLLDELEKNLRAKYKVNLHSIQKREAHVFNSYREASEFRNSVVN